MPINFKPSNPGTRTVPQFRGVVQSDGDVKLVKDGVRYLYDEIQSYAEECDINNIVRRYMNGDVTALGSVQGVYADIMDIPQNRQEALQKVLDAQMYFKDLPSDIKEQFGNSWEQFFMAGDTKEFAEAIASLYEPKLAPVMDETKD